MVKIAMIGINHGPISSEKAVDTVSTTPVDFLTSTGPNTIQLTVHKLNGKWAQTVNLVIDGKGKLVIGWH